MAINKKVKGITGASILWLAAAAGTIVYVLTKKKPPTPPQGLANLYGKVTDAYTDKAIPNVLVTLDSIQTFTNTNGNYTFANLQPGGYRVEFSKEGYETVVY